MSRRAVILSALLATMLVMPVYAEDEAKEGPREGIHTVEVLGLFKNAALLRIGERRQMLRVGQRSGPVKLISANSKQAVIEFDGERRELRTSERIAGTFRAAESTRVTLQRDLRDQYRTSILVNGRASEAIVDTGANLVAFSSVEADRLGIKYRSGERALVETASGVAEAWRVTLDRVELSGILVNRVPAVVVKGASPQITLLGMSWLRHVRLSEEAGVLYLEQRY